MSYTEKDLDKITVDEFHRYVTSQEVCNKYQIILTRGSVSSGFAQYFITTDISKKDEIRKKLQEKGFVFV